MINGMKYLNVDNHCSVFEINFKLKVVYGNWQAI